MSRTPRHRRQYAMTPQTPVLPVGQEAAVAALQATTQHLNEKVADLAKATHEGMASIAHKLDEISKQAADVAAIAAAQREHGTGLERAFGEIRTTNERMNAIERHVVEIDKKAATARGGLIVLTAVGGIMIGLVLWALTPILNQVPQNQKDITELRIELERLKMRSTP